MENGYIAYSKDDSILLQASSGGIATCIARKTILEGGCVYGAAYSSDYKTVNYIRITDIEDVSKLCGSKYIHAHKFKGMNQQIYQDLQDRIVTVIGLPCDIIGIKKYIDKSGGSDNLVLVDLICHGSTLEEVHKQFINYIERKYRSPINTFTVRYKNNGNWQPPYVRVEFKNGRMFIAPFYSTYYGRAFDIMSNEGCYQCHFKGENRGSDITLGDFRGVEQTNLNYNKHGTSLVITHTDKGEKFLQHMNGVYFDSCDLEKALLVNPYYRFPHKKKPIYDKFYRIFKEKGLVRAVQSSLTIKEKIIWLCPSKILNSKSIIYVLNCIKRK